MLLYANNRTFAIDDTTANSLQQDTAQVAETTRDRLAHQVTRALACGIDLLLVHETDEQNCGCAFGDVITRTPPELVAAGLYKKIAVPWHAGPHRTVSLAMVAQALGARRKRSTLEKARQKAACSTRGTTSSVRSRVSMRSSLRSATSRVSIENNLTSTRSSRATLSAPLELERTR